MNNVIYRGIQSTKKSILRVRITYNLRFRYIIKNLDICIELSAKYNYFLERNFNRLFFQKTFIN